MSSPARSSVSASNAVMGDESPFFQFHEDIVSAQDCKLEAMTVLKSDVMAALHKEVKSLDEDSWMFSGPRSKIHLVSRPRNTVQFLPREPIGWNSRMGIGASERPILHLQPHDTLCYKPR
ncbi:protein SAMBA [Nymphaea colorata]|nr:protein SAMBA [Nymphaea colorata]